MAVVTVEGLSKAYGEFVAVDGVSFQIEAGEVFGFLGPNGAGKTSTINMLIGLARPTGGAIKIGGIDAVRETKKAQAIIGVVPDENNLYDDMDGFDNLCFCASLYGMPKAQREEKARALLQQFNLASAEKKLFKRYSKGMRRKLTIAAGLVHDPKILFIDELTSGIDVDSARQIREMIVSLKEKGMTIFLTTHHIEDAQRLCDRVAFLVDGRIVKIGTVVELMADAGSEQLLRLKLSESAHRVVEHFRQTFPDFRIEAGEGKTCLIASNAPVRLLPLLAYLDGQGIAVYEAMQIRPSLEDVFVKMTGIGAEKLRQEKEAGAK